jgi:hypothetical protein
MEKQKLLFCVSAFLEIGRGTWRNHSRTTQQYLNHFANFWGNLESNVTVFCEEYFVEEIESKIKEFEKNKKFLSIVNIQTFNRNDLFYFKNLERIRIVQGGEEMKKYALRDPSGPPEYTSPEWTAIMLSKPYFLKMAFERNLIPENANTIAWADFGIAHCGHNISYVNEIMGKKLLEPIESKITFFNKRNIELIPDPWYMNSIIGGDDTFAVGGFYLVPKKLINELVDKFNFVVEEKFFKNNIIDDDQQVMSIVGSLFTDICRFENSYKYTNNPPEGDFFPIFYTLK